MLILQTFFAALLLTASLTSAPDAGCGIDPNGCNGGFAAEAGARWTRMAPTPTTRRASIRTGDEAVGGAVTSSKSPGATGDDREDREFGVVGRDLDSSDRYVDVTVLDLRPVTPEVAGSSPVGPARLRHLISRHFGGFPCFWSALLEDCESQGESQPLHFS
jgi:hypothetical protein